MKFLVTSAIVALLAVALTAADTPDSKSLSAKEIAVYTEVARSVIDQRLSYTPDAVFFISMSPASSVQPERTKYVIRDAPPEILDPLMNESLPVFPGSAAEQNEQKRDVTHRSTGQAGLRIVLNRIDWAGDSEAIVYCETYAHGTDASGRVYRLALTQGVWSVVSVVYKRKS